MTLKTMTALTAGCAALALLAGCGGGGSGNAEAAGSGETRIVTDATGADIVIPAQPQSVATLHYAATETLMDLGLTPVGQGEYQEASVPQGWVDRLGEVPVVATDEPDIERLATTDPDLILAPNTLDSGVVDQLEDIAPVYQFTLRGGDRANWKQRVGEVADAVNRSAELKALDDAFVAEQTRISEEYSDVTDGTTIATLSSFTENTAYLWGSGNMLGTIYDPLGLTWSADEDRVIAENAEAAEPEAEVSLELVDKAAGDADIVFVTSNLRGEYDELSTALMDSPVFARLPAAQAGNVYPNGKSTIAGYSDANYSLEMVEQALQAYRQR